MTRFKQKGRDRHPIAPFFYMLVLNKIKKLSSFHLMGTLRFAHPTTRRPRRMGKAQRAHHFEQGAACPSLRARRSVPINYKA
jgi:hypothetical protein